MRADTRKLTIDDALGGQEHHSSQRRREDDILSRVEKRERCGYLDRSSFVRFQMSVILLNLVGFVIEVLFGP